MPKVTKLYEIWCEGYRATGESGGATLMGTSRAGNFRDACISFFAGRRDGFNFNVDHLTYWGCSLYPDEAHAAVSFG